MIFVLTTASTCSNDDDDSSSTTTDPTLVINAAMDGTWYISSLIEEDEDNTADFSGYSFTFGASNVLTATNGTNTYTGTWSVASNDDSDDDNPDSDLDFNIYFASPTLFNDELSDDWDIISYTSTKIQLVDVSGGNGGIDYLTFEKN